MRISGRVVKRILVGLALLIGLLLVINGVLAWRANQRFEQRITELRAAGEPASLADLAPRPVAPQQNAAAYLQQIATQLKEFDTNFSRFRDTPLGETWDADSDAGKPATPEQLASLRAIVDALPDIVPALEKAAACPEYASLLDFNLPPREYFEQAQAKGQWLRPVGRYVRLKMIVLVADGKADEAVRLATQMLRLTRLENEPTIVGYLVRCAVRGMMLASLDEPLRRPLVPDVRAALDAELALLDGHEPLHAALRSERAFAISSVAEQSSWAAPALLRWGVLNWLNSELDAEDQAVEAAKLPLDQIRPRWDPAQEKELPPLSLANVAESPLVGGALLMTFSADFRLRAMTRSVRVLNALGEYRDRTGQAAERLDQLSLPAEALADPYSGKPLMLVNADQGWVIYSVWRNGVDDGGRFNGMNGDWGVAPPGYPRNE